MEQPVFIVYSNLGLGGIPTRLIDIINRMAADHPERIVYVLLKKRPSFDRRFLISGKNVVIMDFPYDVPRVGSVMFILWLWGKIFRYSPKVIFACLSPYAIPVLATKILLWRRTIRIVINEGHFTSTMIRTMAFPFLQEWGIRLLYPLADSIIVPTQAIRTDLTESFHIPSRTMIVVKNWSRYAVRSFPPSKKTYDLIYIGRFDKTKHVLAMLVLAQTLIRRYKPTLRFCLMGDGPDGKECLRFIQRYRLERNITILPPNVHVSRYLRASKILLLNAERKAEGFPVAVLDAMSCGTVVLTKDFLGIGETIHDGSNGFIVHTDTEMCDRILYILNHYKALHSVIRNAKQHVKTYNSSENISQYETALFR